MRNDIYMQRNWGQIRIGCRICKRLLQREWWGAFFGGGVEMELHIQFESMYALTDRKRWENKED